MQKPFAPLLATATAVAVLAGAAPAQAAPASDDFSSQATCYGTTSRSYFQTAGWGGQAGPYRTTSRCRDINVRNASQFSTQACVIFIDRTSNCNYWTYLPANSGWMTIATNVKDNVNFKVRFSNSYYQYEPLIAYHAY